MYVNYYIPTISFKGKRKSVSPVTFTNRQVKELTV